MAFSDVKTLSDEHLVTDNEGELWIRKSRVKTNNMCNIPLLDIPKQILEKYKNDPICQKKGVLLPVLSNQKMNTYLDEIAEVCGIKKDITTHVARHSFATLLLTKGAAVESISKILGHTELKTTMIYAKILDDKVIEDAKYVDKQLTELTNILRVQLKSSN